MSFRCMIGLHHWGLWKETERKEVFKESFGRQTYIVGTRIVKNTPKVIGFAIIQTRQCPICGLQQYKSDEIRLSD